MTPSADAPPFVVVCGPPGCGKTIDIVRAVGSSAVVAAAEGALKPVKPVLGIDVMAEYPAKTVEEATKALMQIRKVVANGAKRKPLYYVADEFSYMAERTWSALETRINGYRLWGMMRKIVIDFRDAAREAGVGIIVNCWDQGPTTKSSGKFVRGGPKLPSDLPEQFPGIADFIFLCEHDATVQPWPWRYRTRGDQNWALKDRSHTTPSPAPMNLGEVLRASGYDVPYPVPMQALEGSIDGLAQHLGMVDPSQVMPVCEQAYQIIVNQGTDPRYAKWAVSDARARAALRQSHTLRWASFAAL